MKHKGTEEFQVDMKNFETFLKKLRAEYNQHLIGNVQTPPEFTVAQVRKIIRKYAGDKTLRGTQRFLYFNLVAKFNTMMEFYNRRLRDIEQGRQTAFRITKPGKNESTAKPQHLKTGVPEQDRAYVIANTNQQQIAVKKMYEQWSQYSTIAESAPHLDYDKFQTVIKKKTEQLLRQKNCKAIRYKLSIQDGKIKIQAKPLK
jgi:hypothetical protein